MKSFYTTLAAFGILFNVVAYGARNDSMVHGLYVFCTGTLIKDQFYYISECLPVDDERGTASFTKQVEKARTFCNNFSTKFSPKPLAQEFFYTHDKTSCDHLQLDLSNQFKPGDYYFIQRSKDGIQYIEVAPISSYDPFV